MATPVSDSFGQIFDYTDYEVRTLRIVAISSSCASIVAGLAAFYWWFRIDRRRRVFRHQLILTLILYDFLKSIILLLFPARALQYEDFYSNALCDTVGFFTAVAIEGADFAILAFAVHTALIVFRPERSRGAEGGLYPYRFGVYFLSLAIPIFLAGIAFIGGGYIMEVSWCYLPPYPIWKRMVLSWVPRYCIVVVIITIYISIYLHVVREFHILGTSVSNLHTPGLEVVPEKPNKWHSVKSQLLDLFFCFKSFALASDFEIQETKAFERNNNSPESGNSASDPPNSSNLPHSAQLRTQQPDLHPIPLPTVNSAPQSDSTLSTPSAPPISSGSDNGTKFNQSPSDDPSHNLRAHLQQETLAKFSQRRSMIEKQMKSIFVYPIAYIFLWFFPFLLQCFQFNYEQRHGPIFGLAVLAAFMQPFNCTVDTFVFFFREKPWRYTSERLDEEAGGVPRFPHTSGTIPRSRIPSEKNKRMSFSSFKLKFGSHRRSSGFTDHISPTDKLPTGSPGSLGSPGSPETPETPETAHLVPWAGKHLFGSYQFRKMSRYSWKSVKSNTSSGLSPHKIPSREGSGSSPSEGGNESGIGSGSGGGIGSGSGIHNGTNTGVNSTDGTSVPDKECVFPFGFGENSLDGIPEDSETSTAGDGEEDLDLLEFLRRGY